MRLLTCLFALAFTAFFTSCSEDASLLSSDEQAPQLSKAFYVDENEDGHVHVPALEVAEEVLHNHVDGRSALYEDVEEMDVVRPDGTVDHVYVVDGDIELTKQQLSELRGMDIAMEKQYRTNNLVSDRTITVIGYTGGNNALSNKMKDGLRWAVNNYNALNTNKTFRLSFGASTNADIVVYQVKNGQAGGKAGFPSGGRAYKWVEIYSGMNNYDKNTNEHVITHEIGHAMGLRHTDWFSRASCGQSGESAGSTGAVLIPGTPSGSDPNSVMLACFGANEDGEFGFYDRVALEYLY